MATQTARNGINVTQLVETIEAIKKQPDLAKFQFRAHTTWDGGGRCHSDIQGFFGAGQEDSSREKPFTVVGDEPGVLLGGNAGPNAVEAMLHALASCLSVGFIYNAAAMGIEVRSLKFDVDGDLDLLGFLGLSDKVRPGYSGIRVKYRIQANAPREKLVELCEYVQRTSPVMDIIRNPVPVSVELV
jgi:uncharacterized OsmC-like protein